VVIERYLIVTSYYRIPVPNLPTPFQGLRIVHLSDIHHGALVPLSIVRWVVNRTNRIARDLVLLTGDYVHERSSHEQMDRVWPVLGELTAPEGVYATLGNHDHWADTERSWRWLARTGFDLHHRSVVLVREGEQLWIVGAGDLWEDHVPLDDLLAGIPEEACRIVLAHNPDTADTGFAERIDLMLSGHTHGGQVRVPGLGAPVLPVQNKTYSSGLVYSPRGLAIFISRGIGWAVYPVRLNCLPEIAVLELEKKRPQGPGTEP
jgi:predicted MPP superfamily phosphohydrolase